MGQNHKKIIAIGGGGFTHRSDEVLDKFVIDQCKKKQINFGFLPTASEDNKDKIKLFYSELDKYNIQYNNQPAYGWTECGGIDVWNRTAEINKEILSQYGYKE